mgnify:CR=1 FL=1
MRLMQFLYRWIDPERLIQPKVWWVIGTLAALTGLLFASAVLLMTLGDRSIRETAQMREKIQAIDGLGFELDTLQNYIGRYERSLRAYALFGDLEDSAAVQANKIHITECRSQLYRQVLPGARSELAEIFALTDSIFEAGTKVMFFQGKDRHVDALAELDHLESTGLCSTAVNQTNRLFRHNVALQHRQIEADAGFDKSSFRNTLVVLSSLAGIVFALLVFSMIKTVRRVMRDRRAYRDLYEDQKKAAEFNQNLINILPIGYHSINADGIITDMNQTELDLLGYSREEIVGKTHILQLLADQAFRDKFREMFDKFQAQGFVRNLEVNLLAKNGRSIPALINSKAVYTAKGKYSHSLSTMYNFTERKKLENELVEARKTAEAAQNLKQLFMANMSHEIRTPLNAIVGFANLLGRTRLNTSQKEYVQGMQIAGSNLLGIVNDILDFEKIQCGMLRIEPVTFDLSGLLHSVVTMVRPHAAEKKLALHLETAPDLPGVLVGDPMRLTQILVNLLSNALKFTEKGAVSLRVSTRSGTPGEPVWVRIEVEDTGIGIPASEHSRIFERFIQADAGTAQRYGGTGLGLALVKMLVSLQNGTIQLHSEVGRGSVFTIEIPYRTAQPEDAQTVLFNTDKEEIPDFSGHRILLVEDNPMNRRIAELQLNEFGFGVTLVSNGLEAIDYLRAHPAVFSLVMMDIQMPIMDGYVTTGIIRNELGLRDLPIVAITAHVLTGEREKILASGMNDYLNKPVRPNELVAMLKRYIPSSIPQPTA